MEGKDLVTIHLHGRFLISGEVNIGTLRTIYHIHTSADVLKCKVNKNSWNSLGQFNITAVQLHIVLNNKVLEFKRHRSK